MELSLAGEFTRGGGELDVVHRINERSDDLFRTVAIRKILSFLVQHDADLLGGLHKTVFDLLAGIHNPMFLPSLWAV